VIQEDGRQGQPGATFAAKDRAPETVWAWHRVGMSAALIVSLVNLAPSLGRSSHIRCAKPVMIDGVLVCDPPPAVEVLFVCGPELRAGDRLSTDRPCERRRMAAIDLHALAVAVDVNMASDDELTSLPGIGPTKAAKIVAARPYWSIDGLLDVHGIGEKTLEKIRDRVRPIRQGAQD